MGFICHLTVLFIILTCHSPKMPHTFNSTQLNSTQLNSNQLKGVLFPEIYSIDQLQYGTETHTGLFAPLLLSSKSSILLPLCLTTTG